MLTPDDMTMPVTVLRVNPLNRAVDLWRVRQSSPITFAGAKVWKLFTPEIIPDLKRGVPTAPFIQHSLFFLM